MIRKLQWVCIGLAVIVATILIYHFVNPEDVIEIPETAIREPIERPPPVVVIPEVPTAEPTDEPTEEYIPLPPEVLPRIVQLREYYDNPDIIGYIYIPGTTISYPVVQTGNNVFYLYHDLHWNPSGAGSIFMDYENNPYLLADDNTIIYGHNMRNGTMFHAVRHFHREAFFREHTYILLDTPYRETVWDIFSFFHTTIAFCYLTTNFRNRDDFYEFLRELERRTIFTTDIELSPEDQILILSTCGVTGGPNRYVVVARLRPDEYTLIADETTDEY